MIGAVYMLCFSLMFVYPILLAWELEYYSFASCIAGLMMLFALICAYGQEDYRKSKSGE